MGKVRCLSCPYDERTREVREKIFKDMGRTGRNQIYCRKEETFLFYVNQRGYIHILRPCKEKWKVGGGRVEVRYFMADYLLTKENLLQYKGCRSGYFDTPEECLNDYSQFAEII